MNRASAAMGSALWFAVAPGTVCGVGPWLITRWRRPDVPWLVPDVVGSLLVLVGGAVLVHAFVTFAWHGRGTPAPPAPTERLVVRGWYRYVRNPMYLAVLAVVLGQALLFASWALVVYLAAVAAVTHLFVCALEEPTLRRSYGDEYERYVAAVPRWLPRVTAWSGREREGAS